jgi:hypothetical protein
MKTLRFLPLVCALVPAALGQSPAPAPVQPPTDQNLPQRVDETKSTHFIFSLLPKSLDKNPVLDFTVVTEMTEAGKKLPEVTPDQPAYYTAFSAGFRQIGDTYYGEKTLTPDSVEKVLARALAKNGYQPAGPGHPPSLLIIYSWGSHNRERQTESSTEIEGNLLDSAALVGGDGFAQKMQQMLQQTDEMAGPPDLVAFANPINLYRLSSTKHNFMLDQAAGDMYFVVASAYDYASAASNDRVLVWRSRMTVSSVGVNQQETLPKLILTAAPYFGRDMSEPEIFTGRRHEGQVDIGPLRVMDVNGGGQHVLESGAAEPYRAQPLPPPPPPEATSVLH